MTRPSEIYCSRRNNKRRSVYTQVRFKGLQISIVLQDSLIVCRYHYNAHDHYHYLNGPTRELRGGGRSVRGTSVKHLYTQVSAVKGCKLAERREARREKEEKPKPDELIKERAAL